MSSGRVFQSLGGGNCERPISDGHKSTKARQVHQLTKERISFLRNDLYCVGWGSLTHLEVHGMNLDGRIVRLLFYVGASGREQLFPSPARLSFSEHSKAETNSVDIISIVCIVFSIQCPYKRNTLLLHKQIKGTHEHRPLKNFWEFFKLHALFK